jgi:Vitamin K-dependent gamma-carboxylase
MTAPTGTAAKSPLVQRAGSLVARWWFVPQPRARIAVLRMIVYAFVIADVLLLTAGAPALHEGARDLYEPLFAARALRLAVPTPEFALALRVAVVVSAVVALRRGGRLAGMAVFATYLGWMFLAFSYGKVDHDRVALLVALATLPAAGPARRDDPSRDDAAGWTLRCIQVAVVLTYFFAAWSKLRFGGLEWLNGSTLLRAVLRRGTPLGASLVEAPWVLQAAQYGIVAFELSTPLAFAGAVPRRAVLIAAGLFHAFTYAAIRITFLPHVVCLLAFVPVERLQLPKVLLRSQLAAPPGPRPPD